MIRYVDTSVYLKTLVEEPDSNGAVALLRNWRSADDAILSSAVIITELHRAGQRWGLPPENVRRALDRLRIVRLSDDLLEVAGVIPGGWLRSLDAIHIATALEVGADSFATTDRQQGEAASDAGLNVVSTFE